MSPSPVSPRFIHVVAGVRTPFLFKAASYSIVQMDYLLFIHWWLPVCLTIDNSAALSMSEHRMRSMAAGTNYHIHVGSDNRNWSDPSSADQGLRSRWGRATLSLPPEDPGVGGSFLPFSVLGLRASMRFWPCPSHLSLWLLCVCVSFSIFSKDTCHWIQDHPNPWRAHPEIPVSITSAKKLFPNKVARTGSEG